MAFGEHEMIYHTLNDNINPLQVNLVDVAASVDAVEVEAEDAEEVTVVDVEVRLTP